MQTQDKRLLIKYEFKHACNIYGTSEYTQYVIINRSHSLFFFYRKNLLQKVGKRLHPNKPKVNTSHKKKILSLSLSLLSIVVDNIIQIFMKKIRKKKTSFCSFFTNKNATAAISPLREQINCIFGGSKTWRPTNCKKKKK